MTELLQNILESSQTPAITAFLLGLLTAISPCPLATNITAVGYISQDISNRRLVFIKGLIYTVGRALTYSAIGLLFYIGADQFKLSEIILSWGEKILGPLLIITGIIMLGILSIPLPGLGKLTDKIESKASNGLWGAFLLGVVFALSFCPYSGVLYFGMLIPITITSVQGLILPVIFAIATGIPVVLFAWLIAYSMGAITPIYNKIKLVERWFRRVVAILFICAGIYFSFIYFFQGQV